MAQSAPSLMHAVMAKARGEPGSVSFIGQPPSAERSGVLAKAVSDEGHDLSSCSSSALSEAAQQSHHNSDSGPAGAVICDSDERASQHDHHFQVHEMHASPFDTRCQSLEVPRRLEAAAAVAAFKGSDIQKHSADQDVASNAPTQQQAECAHVDATVAVERSAIESRRAAQQGEPLLQGEPSFQIPAPRDCIASFNNNKAAQEVPVAGSGCNSTNAATGFGAHSPRCMHPVIQRRLETLFNNPSINAYVAAHVLQRENPQMWKIITDGVEDHHSTMDGQSCDIKAHCQRDLVGKKSPDESRQTHTSFNSQHIQHALSTTSDRLASERSNISHASWLSRPRREIVGLATPNGSLLASVRHLLSSGLSSRSDRSTVASESPFSSLQGENSTVQDVDTIDFHSAQVEGFGDSGLEDDKAGAGVNQRLESTSISQDDDDALAYEVAIAKQTYLFNASLYGFSGSQARESSPSSSGEMSGALVSELNDGSQELQGAMLQPVAAPMSGQHVVKPQASSDLISAITAFT